MRPDSSAFDQVVFEQNCGILMMMTIVTVEVDVISVKAYKL